MQSLLDNVTGWKSISRYIIYFTSSTDSCSFAVHSGSFTCLWHPYLLSSFHADSTIVGVNRNTCLQPSIWAMWTKPFVTFHEILVGQQGSLERHIAIPIKMGSIIPLYTPANNQDFGHCVNLDVSKSYLPHPNHAEFHEKFGKEGNLPVSSSRYMTTEPRDRWNQWIREFQCFL